MTAPRDNSPDDASIRDTIGILTGPDTGEFPLSRRKVVELCESVLALRARLSDAQEVNKRLNRRCQENESAAKRFAEIQARIDEFKDKRKPLPRMEAAFALCAAESKLAAVERERNECGRLAAEQGVLASQRAIALAASQDDNARLREAIDKLYSASLMLPDVPLMDGTEFYQEWRQAYMGVLVFAGRRPADAALRSMMRQLAGALWAELAPSREMDAALCESFITRVLGSPGGSDA